MHSRLRRQMDLIDHTNEIHTTDASQGCNHDECDRPKLLVVKSLLDHPVQFGKLVWLESEFGLRCHQMSTVRGKPFRSVIDGQPGRIQRTV